MSHSRQVLNSLKMLSSMEKIKHIKEAEEVTDNLEKLLEFQTFNNKEYDIKLSKDFFLSSSYLKERAKDIVW